jgi:uncharacterized C2H2 Zn-finger protein
MVSTRFKCPICEFTCGRKKKFNDHLIKTHTFSSIEDAYIQIYLNGVVPICQCNICTITPTFISWSKGFRKFITGHNGNIYTSYNIDKANEISKRRSKALIGRVGWSKGLTKETNTSIKKASKTRQQTVQAQYNNGDRVAWNKGLTKECDSRLLAQSINMKKKYTSGVLVPWAKGLTKETDNRILQMSYVVSETLKKSDLQTRLNLFKRLSKEEIKRRLTIGAPHLELLTNLDDYTRDRDKNLIFKCKVCDYIQKKSLLSALSDRCEKCNPIGSKQQIEIDRFIRSMNFETIMCTRDLINPYEIDIYVDSKKFGIEFNGLYFHSELFKNRQYHSDKTSMCKKIDVRLMHIFGDEWREKQDICKSMIAHKLGVYETTIYARKCIVKPVSYKVRKKFFNDNHIDGDVKSTHAIGLYLGDMLISCMSLRRPYHKKYKGKLEVARFCMKLRTHAPGALSRLTKHAMTYCKANGFTGLLTYVDMRLGSKNGYLSAGWNYLGETSNRFWWTDGRSRIDRFKIRADKANKITEKEMAESLGVVKIWGCTNLIFSKNNS